MLKNVCFSAVNQAQKNRGNGFDAVDLKNGGEHGDHSLFCHFQKTIAQNIRSELHPRIHIWLTVG